MTTPQIEDAKRANRLARTIAGDIALYNKEAVEQGVINDDLFERIAENIQEGRDLYELRVVEPLRSSTNFFDRALVDILLRAQARVPSRIW